jgi:hypothetical protein
MSETRSENLRVPVHVARASSAMEWVNEGIRVAEKRGHLLSRRGQTISRAFLGRNKWVFEKRDLDQDWSAGAFSLSRVAKKPRSARQLDREMPSNFSDVEPRLLSF